MGGVNNRLLDSSPTGYFNGNHVYYIKKLRERYSGSLVLALAAYNAGLKKGDEWAMGGPGKNVGEEINRITYPETKKFVTDVLKTYSRLKTARKIKRLLEFE